jgi:signal transduction histidine kinase
VLTQLCFRGAMGMRGGGTLTITTSPAAHPAGAAHGRGVAIRVEDTGVPLTGGAVSGLLEPYAEHLPTGDPSRRPSGLELAMADGFARQVGGTVTVESGTGQGTAVTLVLPAAPPATSA